MIPRPLITYQEVRDSPLLPLTWDVEPLVSRGDRVVVFGEFASMKSWIFLHLALHLGSGQAWLGFPVPEPRRVLYVDEEMNERTLRRRVKRLGEGAGVEVAPGLTFLSRAGVRFDAYGAQTLLAHLGAYRPQVVIVEALRRVLIGDENEARDMAQFWRNLEPISRQGITLVITHHMNKPPAQGKRAARYRASGSTDILAGSDASFAVERTGKDTAKLTGIKSRDDVELPPFLVRLDDAGDRTGPVTLTPGLAEAPQGPREPLTPEEQDDVFRRTL